MAMSATTAAAAAADCELLGRGPVQGSADSDGLAALVRQLCKQQQRGRLPGRRCTVTCSRDAGLEIVPHQSRKRPDDEGFESDEDLASLGSYEDPSKRKISGGGGGGGGMSALAAASVAAGAGSDSANSSGVSEDSDDADAASLREQSAVDPSGGQIIGGVGVGVGREAYGLADVAFCHTDAAALPGIAVWVIKTRRTSAAGLEAIVVRSRGDDSGLQDVCRAYQEHSRRLKLEPKPWAGQSNGASSQRRKIVGSGGGGGGSGVAVTLTAAPEVNRYNLVQRTDTDGVTHIEVTAGPVAAAERNAGAAGRDEPPSSIISLSTPESPRLAAKDLRDGGGVYADESREQQPPQRPERRKYKQAKPETGEDFRRQQKVVRGQFIRVNVNHCAALPPDSPEPEKKQPVAAPSQQESSGKSTSAAVAAAAAGSDRLWSTADYDRLDGRYDQHRRSSRSGSRTRSRSTGPARRQHELSAAVQTQPPPPPQQQQQQYPQPPVAFSRYPNVEQQQQPLSTFGTRFFGKLREITTGNQSHLLQQDLQPVTFRRRNSVGESVTANFYQYFGHQHHHHHHHQHNQYQQQHYHHQQHHLQQQQQQQQQQQRQQVKNGGNLKSVIKKNNKSQPYQHAYDEPKKVTFSAYATVQVVD